MQNNKISKKGTFGTTMGVASVITILVILVLIVFASLSIMTAEADYRLSKKTAEAATAYYKADNAAEEQVAVIAALTKAGEGWEKILGNGYTVKKIGGDVSVSYVIPMEGDKELDVTLSVDGSGNISRTLWQVTSTSEWVSDNHKQLIIE